MSPTKYATQFKLICFGRDLDAQDWQEILCNPCTLVECEAFVDACVFLNVCEKLSYHDIAKMLETNISEVRAAVASRGYPHG